MSESLKQDILNAARDGYQPINDPSKQTVDWSKLPTTGSNVTKLPKTLSVEAYIQCLENELIKQIIYSLKYEEDLTYKDLANLYKIDYSQICLINQGKIYHIDKENYPIRKKRKKDLDKNIVDNIINILEKRKYSNDRNESNGYST